MNRHERITVSVALETETDTEEEHMKQVRWVVNNIVNANEYNVNLHSITVTAASESTGKIVVSRTQPNQSMHGKEK